MERFIIKNNKKYRYGYTTGSCATAASKAAAMTLLGYGQKDYVKISTPKGWDLDIEAFFVEVTDDYVICYVVKDGGDDPDATHGMKIYAKVEISKQHGIEIDGGIGIGRVTKRGLSVPIGKAAINPVPLEMIKNAVMLLIKEQSKGFVEGLRIEIFAPEGVEIAKKTFNSKLGIIGGISILGTSGIVEPMSEEAYKQALKVELSVKSAAGYNHLIYAFGNYGQDFLRSYGTDEDYLQKTSNFVEYMLKEAGHQGFKKILFVGHIGKMVKVSLGVKDTHSKYGDRRMEAILSASIACGFDEGNRDMILKCNTTDEAVELLNTLELTKKVFEYIAQQCKVHCEAFSGNRTEVECLLFSNVFGELGRTQGVEQLLKEFVND